MANMDILLYLLSILVLWVLNINIIKIQLQKETIKSKEYFYDMVIKLIAYKDNIIIGETCRRQNCAIVDKHRQFKERVNNHIGEMVVVSYNVEFHGWINITAENLSCDIQPVDTKK